MPFIVVCRCGAVHTFETAPDGSRYLSGETTCTSCFQCRPELDREAVLARVKENH